jgi:hypothetical protein
LSVIDVGKISCTMPREGARAPSARLFVTSQVPFHPTQQYAMSCTGCRSTTCSKHKKPFKTTFFNRIPVLRYRGYRYEKILALCAPPAARAACGLLTPPGIKTLILYPVHQGSVPPRKPIPAHLASLYTDHRSPIDWVRCRRLDEPSCMGAILYCLSAILGLADRVCMS